MQEANEIQLSERENESDESSIYFIGTATTLIRCGGFTILTDPNFIHKHEKVDLGGGLSATRLTDPAMTIGQLPYIDLIVLSHFHRDHFDQVAERDLPKSLPIVTTPHASGELNDRGFNNTYPLETWSSVVFRKAETSLRITSTPGKHGPPLVDLILPDVMGSILEFHNGNDIFQRIYITGDTLIHDDLKEIPQRYPDLDIGLVHLGGTRVLGILVTMDAEQGIQLLQMVQPKVAIPIHYDDYDVFKSPLEEFQTAVSKTTLASRIHYLGRGETYTILLPTTIRSH
jgi:L-ascorbate metabolism protein UlaG (beta-lactamase superfamily)